MDGKASDKRRHWNSCCCSVTKSCLILWHCGLQHDRFLGPPLSPRVCPNSFLSWWCYLTISPSSALFSFSWSTFPIIRVFSSELTLHIRWPKYWSFSFSNSPSNEYSGLIFLLGWTGWISLQSKGLSRVFSNPQFKSINSLVLSFLHSPTLTSIDRKSVV